MLLGADEDELGSRAESHQSGAGEEMVFLHSLKKKQKKLFFKKDFL